jgi:hypothetical protein
MKVKIILLKFNLDWGMVDTALAKRETRRETGLDGWD